MTNSSSSGTTGRGSLLRKRVQLTHFVFFHLYATLASTQALMGYRGTKGQFVYPDPTISWIQMKNNLPTLAVLEKHEMEHEKP